MRLNVLLGVCLIQNYHVGKTWDVNFLDMVSYLKTFCITFSLCECVILYFHSEVVDCASRQYDFEECCIKCAYILKYITENQNYIILLWKSQTASFITLLCLIN